MVIAAAVTPSKSNPVNCPVGSQFHPSVVAQGDTLCGHSTAPGRMPVIQSLPASNEPPCAPAWNGPRSATLGPSRSAAHPEPRWRVLTGRPYGDVSGRGTGGSRHTRRGLSSRLRERVAQWLSLGGDRWCTGRGTAIPRPPALLPEDVALLPSQDGHGPDRRCTSEKEEQYEFSGSWRDQMEALRARHGAEHRGHGRGRCGSGAGCPRGVLQRLRPGLQGLGRQARR